MCLRILNQVVIALLGLEEPHWFKFYNLVHVWIEKRGTDQKKDGGRNRIRICDLYHVNIELMKTKYLE